MLVGESTLLALMLSGSLVVLFVLAQRRKQQREDMEKLLQFTSHEFKTPVAGVKGLLQSLAIGSIPEAQRAELIQLGQMECDRLEHLAETILAYQRAMARDPREGVQRIDAARFIADLLAHRARTSSGGTVEVAAIEAVHVLADRDGLRVILENLLDNAHKYGGGQVRIAAARQRRPLAPRHQRSGPRLRARSGRETLRPAQSRQRRRHHPRRRAGTRHCATAGSSHGRRHLGAQRRPGTGRGIHRDTDAGAAGSGNRRSRRAPRMADRIAIVEDERLVRELVAVNLRHAGYEIVAAENFDEGKATARRAVISSWPSST